MNSLCNRTFGGYGRLPFIWSETVTLGRVTAHKLFFYGGSQLGQARDFTKAGYNGTGPSGSGCTDCRLRSGNVAPDTLFTWRWTPYEK